MQEVLVKSADHIPGQVHALPPLFVAPVTAALAERYGIRIPVPSVAQRADAGRWNAGKVA